MNSITSLNFAHNKHWAKHVWRFTKGIWRFTLAHPLSSIRHCRLLYCHILDESNQLNKFSFPRKTEAGEKVWVEFLLHPLRFFFFFALQAETRLIYWLLRRREIIIGWRCKLARGGGSYIYASVCGWCAQWGKLLFLKRQREANDDATTLIHSEHCSWHEKKKTNWTVALHKHSQ